jgi:hypothetical protein
MQTPISQLILSTNQRQASISTYKEIIEQKGSRCRCKYFNSLIAQQERSQTPRQIYYPMIKKPLHNRFQSNINQISPLASKTREGKCGSYCKHLGARDQKKVIKTLKKAEALSFGITESTLFYLNQ